MPQHKTSTGGNGSALHWVRFIAAVLALLIAATHLNYVVPNFAQLQQVSHIPANQTAHQGNQTGYPYAGRTGSGGPSGFADIGLWFDIEVIAYTIIAVVYLLGLRNWYVPAVLFNALNVFLYFGSGFFAIPGLTGMAFGNRFSAFAVGNLNMEIMMASWIALLILGIAMLRYDPGSELDRLLVTKRTV